MLIGDTEFMVVPMSDHPESEDFTTDATSVNCRINIEGVLVAIIPRLVNALGWPYMNPVCDVVLLLVEQVEEAQWMESELVYSRDG
jgi:hypothetical protein